MSLSPRPDRFTTTMSEGENFIFPSAASACALSSAGIMPSRRVSSMAASRASPSLATRTLLRPFSGSGSVSYVTSLYSRFGADSETARLAAILASSTETTFYAAAVYFGGRGLRSTRYTIPAALCGDCMAVVLSVVSIRLFG